MTFRRRLLAASMLTLAVGLGALLVVGNVVLGVSANNDQMRLLQTRVDAEIAALTVRDGHVVVRNSPDDQSLDREAWIFDGARVIERPAGGNRAVDRAAMRLGRAGRTA
jgi:two-component system heavy metal sensor histidine kinase CusS